MSQTEFSHLGPGGDARMVNVTDKTPTLRQARASARVTVGPMILDRILRGGLEKGDLFAVARVAGIQAAKRTAELIPLCHGLSPEHVSVDLSTDAPGDVVISAQVALVGKTGVEMEALVAASVAALTVYDMCKALGKEITIGPIRLEEKTGGKSGDWRRV